MNLRLPWTNYLFAALLLGRSAAMAQTPVISSVVNTASYQNSLSPGAPATIFGTNLAPSGALNLTVTLAGVPCAVTFPSAGQVNMQLPVGAATGTAALVVSHDGLTSAPFDVNLNQYSPAIFTLNRSGTGSGDFIDGVNVVSSTTPANVGDTVEGIGEGLGATNPVVPTGAAAPSSPLAYTVMQPTVTVGGVPATVTFSGLEPMSIGFDQVNFVIPAGTLPGTQNVIWTIGGVQSPPVTIYIAVDPPDSISLDAGFSNSTEVYTQFSQPFATTVYDAHNNVVAGATVTFTPPSSGAGITFANGIDTAVTNSDGIATIVAYANGTAGTYTVTATSPGVRNPVTFTLTNTVPANPVYLLTTTAIGNGTVSPGSGQKFASGAIVQVIATPSASNTFSGWTGPVADPYNLATTVTMSASQSVTANFVGQAFTDVPPSDYYFSAVNLMSLKGITAGCGSGNYCPTLEVTRAEMAIFIVRAIIGSDNFTYSPNPYFTDVPANAFGFQWIQELYELGVTAGCGGTDYCPNETVTRDQMAIFIIRARYGSTVAFNVPTVPYFTDVPSTDFAFNWIQRMAADNITAGCGLGLYCPTSPVTRGDMAIFIMRGCFNQLLPPTEPIITQVSPTTIAPGQMTLVTVTGANTTFATGTTVVNQPPGFTVGAVTVISPTTLTVSLTAQGTDTIQPESLWITTGTEQAVIPNVLNIQ